MNAFSTERQLAATPEAVYAALIDPERLARWWGPAGFRNHFERCEVRVGGAWEFQMIGPDGQRYPNQSRFERLEPGRLWEIRHLNAPHFVLTIELSVHGEGTLLRWTQSFDEAAVAAALREIVVPANEQNLDRLAAELSVVS